MGGAAGHMNHPFDLGWVNTGSDLLKFFDRAKTFVGAKGAGSVKIDGVNVSFKVVQTPEGHQFAVDRGSMKEIDISGITMGRVDQRFPEGHGMRPAIRTLLTILNNSISETENELKELGMWDDSSKFLNTEYVSGTTNVTSYDKNFLAIHGLNQFYQRVAKSGASKGNVRPGVERPEGVKAPSREISYNEEAMQRFVDKLQPYAKEYGFEVYGSVPTESMADVEYSSTLSEPFTVKVSEDREITKSLEEWLSIVNNPRYKTIKLKNGKKTHPLHKDLYRTILSQQTPLTNLVEEADAEDVIAGAIFMHATRMLGNDVLSSLTSPMGDVMSHEGVVIRDEELFGPNPVKITGEFILGGMSSAFQQDTSLTEEDEEFEPEEIEKQTIAIVPGAFKPPHKGHADMVSQYAEMADKVIVLISKPTKKARTLPNGREVTATDSKRIWEEVFGPDLPENVEVQISTMASPLSAAFEAIGKNGDFNPETDIVILGASDKEDSKGYPDWHRWKAAERYAKEGLEVRYGDDWAVGCTKRACGTPFSASTMRDDLLQKLIDDPGDKRAYEALTTFFPADRIDVLFSILDLEPPRIEELSGMGSSSVAGAMGGINVDDDDNAEDILLREQKSENITVDEIMRLIMERGILQ